METLQKNQTVRVVIEGYSSEGLGIARVNGQVVFVHRAIRGEDCDILIMKVLKHAAFGKVTAIHTPSEHRQEPDCPYYGRGGGTFRAAAAAPTATWTMPRNWPPNASGCRTP